MFEYPTVFGASGHVEQPANEVSLERAPRNARLDQKEDLHATPHARPGRDVMRGASSATFALRVHQFLVQHEAPHRLDMKAVARALKLSVRTLRRRLASEGTTYRAVENEALRELAIRLLQDRQGKIRDTAAVMGFSDASAFDRAFKRWTGTTPRAFREQQRSDARG